MLTLSNCGGDVSSKPLARVNKKVPATILALGLAVFFMRAALGARADLNFLENHGTQAVAVVIAKEGFGRYTATTMRFESVRDGLVEVTPDEMFGDEEVGEEIAVIYDPDDPSFMVDARELEDPFVLYYWWFMAGVCGLFAALTGFGVIDWQRWSNRH